MQKVQKGGGVVVTVVIVSIDDEYDARSSWLAHAVKQWRMGMGIGATGDGQHERVPRVRVVLHQVKDDTCVVGILTAAVLPKLNGPVVIMRGNTTAILSTDIRTWIDRWMASDVPVWCTAVDTSSAIQQWYDTVVTGVSICKKKCVQPVWGAFSGMATALTAALTPHVGSGDTMDVILQRLVDAGEACLDTTPLVELGIHKPHIDVATLDGQLWAPIPLWCRVAWTAKAAVATRDGKIITAASGIFIVLLCVILALSVVVASKKPRPL